MIDLCEYLWIYFGLTVGKYLPNRRITAGNALISQSELSTGQTITWFCAPTSIRWTLTAAYFSCISTLVFRRVIRDLFTCLSLHNCLPIDSRCETKVGILEDGYTSWFDFLERSQMQSTKRCLHNVQGWKKVFFLSSTNHLQVSVLMKKKIVIWLNGQMNKCGWV